MGIFTSKIKKSARFIDALFLFLSQFDYLHFSGTLKKQKMDKYFKKGKR
ncbi:hypothetical protein BMWSH_4250 [Priestia megaterium WSH-002]|uniref:Uncharacterized protein n=1 Tax=Priestia megaterium (strain WSH-002) TaxID=1006007 RepID=A0A8D3X238_PRIMW|nr:hypothetical protein BMWSH_4250 [Priestia megaterium WSH-002]